MWDEEYIDNDLEMIDKRTRCYYAGDCEEKNKF